MTRECRSAIMILAVCFGIAFKDALKFGFYELQSARHWYREATADIGMHADLVKYWISVATLMITPFALTLRSTSGTVEGASFRPAGFMARPRTRRRQDDHQDRSLHARNVEDDPGRGDHVTEEDAERQGWEGCTV
ncbi:hypothetical protein M405DRAFT_156298 [Rhizopogon salebrosus TDB-379]|nr:hypothetical protein M405DRAFT_156298 [Rhizopogon salebrosus TDB-379]